ncbi:MAG: YbaN family protein [Pseudomonadota bacterium]
MPPVTPVSTRPLWQRVLWGTAGVLALLAGLVGIFLPLLPTTPFVLLAAFCFSRGSARLEAWLLAHPRFGPLIADWRARRAMPLRAKQLAWAMMAVGSAWAAWVLPPRWAWLPALCCTAVAVWMWRLPNSAPRP